jgi:hypothetical protein
MNEEMKQRCTLPLYDSIFSIAEVVMNVGTLSGEADFMVLQLYLQSQKLS